jgi:hypothetical protein
MKFFLATTFIQGASELDLVSLGIRAEDGREFYRQNQECCFKEADAWVTENILSNLTHLDWFYDRGARAYKLAYSAVSPRARFPWATRREILQDLQRFIGDGPEFWSYRGSYDWVLLCLLFGSYASFPLRWPRYCFHLEQRRQEMGAPSLPEQPDGGARHHALDRARWTHQAWSLLDGYAKGRSAPSNCALGNPS